MAYAIVFTSVAERELKRIALRDRERISARIDGLAAEPRPAGVKALQGGGGLLRLRVGDYRVLYEVRDTEVIVIVVRIGHRREVYRGV